MAKRAIPKKVKSEIDRYVNVLEEDKLPIKQVILFGSWAKGKPRRWSDFYLCIISPKFKSGFDAIEYLWSKREIFDVNYTIEPVGYHPKDFIDEDPLAWEIKKNGIVVR